jgi:acetyltransferase-like isoleucine patch superfamily enzyme
MKKLYRAIMQSTARRRVAKSCELTVGLRSVVDYRGLVASPPRRFTVGAGSIFQASVTADRPDASVSVGFDSFVGGTRLVCANEISIGNHVLIAWGGLIVDHDSHSLNWWERANDVSDTLSGRKDWRDVRIERITIRDRAWIGYGVTIMRGVEIGEGAIVAACSVVTKSVPPYTLVAGNPARHIRNLPRG